MSKTRFLAYLSFTITIKQAFTADCAMLGIIDPEMTTKDVIPQSVKNACNKDGQKSCCTKQQGESIERCWNTVKNKGINRTQEIRKLINSITSQRSVNILNEFIDPGMLDTRRVLSIELQKYSSDLRSEEYLLSGKNLTHEEKKLQKRILAVGSLGPTEIVKKSEQDLKERFKRGRFNYQLEDIFNHEATKCWTHYFNTIQRGLICSLCLDDSNVKYYNFSGDNKGQLTFTYPSCDYLIPYCFKLMSIQTDLLDFFRDIIILIYNKLYQGSNMINYITRFMTKFPEADKNNLVADCRDRANCDPLCNNTIKFGDFSNIYIIGNYQIMKLMDKIIQELGENHGESIWTFTKNKINEGFVDKYMNVKDFLNETNTDDVTTSGCFNKEDIKSIDKDGNAAGCNISLTNSKNFFLLIFFRE